MIRQIRIWVLKWEIRQWGYQLLNANNQEYIVMRREQIDRLNKLWELQHGHSACRTKVNNNT